MLNSPTIRNESMSRANVQGLLALPWCGIQLLATAASLLGDEPLEAANPALAGVVVLAFVFGVFALTESILHEPGNQTAGSGRLIMAGLVVMLGLDIWSAIHLAELLPHAGPIMSCGKILVPVMLGGRMVVTGWNLASRSWNWAMAGMSMAESGERG
jgi:hypothetical protein